MIETAKNALNADTLEHLREAAQDALGEHIPAPALKKRRRRAPRVLLLLLVVVGAVALAMYVRKMSEPAPETDTAPDPFGLAVEEQRDAMRVAPGRVTTPGA
jgi:hypothetical protein